jgi:hypothetical protein
MVISSMDAAPKVLAFRVWYSENEKGTTPNLTMEAILVLMEAHERLKAQFRNIVVLPSEFLAVAEELFQELRQKEERSLDEV